MAGWLLTISRDTELTRALVRMLIRNGAGEQLWTVEDPQQARRELAGRDTLPCAILIDELFLHGEQLAAVAEEFAWYAPLILVACSERQVGLASLVAAGKADFVSRSDYFIPLALALVERALRGECEVKQHAALRALPDAAPEAGQECELDENSFPIEALRTIRAILDNLELVLAERERLPVEIARRLGRVADLAFDMKHRLRLLAGCVDEPDATAVGTNRRV